MNKKLTLPCLRGVIGDWVYYSTLMTPEQIANTFMTEKQIRERKSLEDFLQRALKERVQRIAKYLLTEERRFFNSIIAGVFGGIPHWYEIDLSENTILKAEIDKIENIEMSMGILKFSGDEKIFAIDGQHRVESIKIALHNDLEKKPEERILKDDQFSVVFVAHIDDKEGKRRTRRLFSDINKRAVPVSAGDKVIIDEEELPAIVARRIYADYEYFDSGKLISLTEQARLEDKDISHFTNLLTLYKVNKILKKLHKKPRGIDELSPENIENFNKIVADFYDFVIESVSYYRQFFIKKSLTLKEVRRNNSNLIFRPIGLTMLAKLYVFFSQIGKLEFLRTNINKIDYSLPGKHFDKIIWNNGKIEAKNQTLAFDLSLFLLDHLDEQKFEEFEEKFRTATKGSREIPERPKLVLI